MRSLLFFLFISLSATAGFAQNDSTRSNQTTQQPPTHAPVIPGVDAPLSGPGTLMQSSPRPNEVTPQPGRRKRKLRTNPPSDPRAFGVAVPIEGARKDSVRN